MNHKSSPVTYAREDEESILPEFVLPRIKYALQNPLSQSRTQMRRDLAAITQDIHDLQITRRDYITPDDIEEMANMIAEQTILRWRLFCINKLPVEILQKIFVLAAHSVPCHDIARARTTLTAVCSRWRWAAFGTPELWSIIRVNKAPPLPMVQHCLQLAKAYPIQLIIDLRNPNWSRREHDVRIDPDKLHTLTQSLAATLNRVSRLVIYADTWAEISVIECALHAIPPPPLLQRLEMHRTGDSYVSFRPPTSPPPGLRTPLRLFNGARAPRLDHLTFDGVFVDFRSAAFTNLRTLEMRKMPVEQLPTLADFLPVLHGSPYLERLLFGGACPKLPGSSAPAWHPVQLSRLFELELSDLVPSYCIFLIRLVRAPELQRLTLKGLRGPDFTPFFEKLSGRYPKVTVLTLNELGTTNVPVLAAWFRSMPLRHLRVTRLPDAFFEALFPITVRVSPGRREQQQFHVCPRLETCHLLELDSVNFEAFKRFCEARQGTLRNIVLSNSSPPNNEIIAWCKTRRVVWMLWKEEPEPVHGNYYYDKQT